MPRHALFPATALLAATLATLAPAIASATAATAHLPQENLPTVTLKYSFPPRYPDAAVSTCAHGKTRVRVGVDEQGVLKKMSLESSSGNDHLDAAALSAVRLWQFLPRVIDGVPQGGEVIVPVNFQDPCPDELSVDDPAVRSLIPPPGWTSQAAPEGWAPYEVTTGRTKHPPKYPKAARRQCAGGTVQLRVTVAANGNVRNVAVAQSSGNADLDAAAADAAKWWQYRAGRRGDKVVGGDVVVPVTYESPC